MARIEWVKDRLDNWARWAVQRESGSLGYPKQAAFARSAGRGRRGEAEVPIDNLDAALTDEAVNALRKDHYHLYLTLRYIYIDGLDIVGTAQRMCRAASTIKAQLERADQVLALWFYSRADEKKRTACHSAT